MHLVTRECITSIHGTSCILVHNEIYLNLVIFLSLKVFELVILDFWKNKEYLKKDMPEILFN